MHREGLQSRIHVMGSKAFWIEEREWEQFEMGTGGARREADMGSCPQVIIWARAGSR